VFAYHEKVVCFFTTKKVFLLTKKKYLGLIAPSFENDSTAKIAVKK
jgi:hypothetical protein